MQTREIVVASAAAAAVSVLSYALFFDHQRRTNPEFRRHLRRNERRKARVEKETAEAAKDEQRKAIRQAVDEAKAAGFPTDVEEKESFFLSQVQEGEVLAADPANDLDAALAFYRAMKVYPTPHDLISIYDKSVAKRVLDVLAEMIAYDSSLNAGSYTGGISMEDLGNIPTAGLD
ncbi:MAS20 protein import receptor [Zalerion maritima]|uniref:Mitochondrial import receptor subunit TOM20 n=1 Tax=Zalerion maritima TaxID=339359 RepID=A0AAD5RW61_9PEZI|nr:MAS20 protein import receptor [Zalerion maritima]